MPLTERQEEHLEEILQLAGSPKLNAWENSFLSDLAGRYEREGPDVVVTGKMWTILNKIDDKVHGV